MEEWQEYGFHAIEMSGGEIKYYGPATHLASNDSHTRTHLHSAKYLSIYFSLAGKQLQNQIQLSHWTCTERRELKMIND